MYHEFTVLEPEIGMRIDKFLSSRLPEFSRNEIQRFPIKLNGAVVKLATRVRLGDVLSVETLTPVATVATENISTDFDLDILFEDDDIIVVNKPRGIVMYPSAGNKTGTLVQNILAHTHLSVLGGETRPGVVHRLDKDTSGVMVFAKSDAAYRALVKMFMVHDLTRRYIAFAWGVPTWTAATITGNIARSSRNRQKMSMVKTGGKPAETKVVILDAWPRVGVTEFQCELMTGRTHQIRVHLSAHGFPLLCDPIYGHGTSRLGAIKKPELLEFIREHHGQMLHAAHLGFVHPTNGKKLNFHAPLPDDMLELKGILDG